MNHGDRDYDELLSRALHEAVDWLEPSEGGLERIRARLTRPRSTPLAWVMVLLSGWRARLRAARSHRSRRWLCAAAVVSAVVVAGTAGALALTPLPGQAVSRTDALIRSLVGGGSAGGTGGQGVNGSGTRPATGPAVAAGTTPPITPGHRHAAPAKGPGSAPSPAASRAACPSPAASPSPGASASPGASPGASASPGAGAGPSGAACPSPAASPSPGAGASPSPSVSPSPTASPSPAPSPKPGASLGPGTSLGQATP
jgi:hypothetical protein